MLQGSKPFARLLVVLALCGFCWGQTAKTATKTTAKPAPTPAEAQKFIEETEKQLSDLVVKASRAAWVQSNFITDDTVSMAADANNAVIGATTERAIAATRFNALKLPYDAQRKLNLLKLSLPMPAPTNAAERKELTDIAASLEADYGKGKFCIEGGKPKVAPDADINKENCYDLTKAEEVMRTSTDPALLLQLWEGWRLVSPPMRQRYARFVDLSNKGAREMGFKDVGSMWRSNYDMAPDAFAGDVERLWNQVKPLYLQLHAYVRSRLAEKYGPNVVPANGMIPAHLLGNMWAQEWNNIYPLVAPPNAAPSFDLTELLQKKNMQPLDMVRTGEKFFTSLGFPVLPQTFYERSLFVKPADRDVVCHASAWDIDNKDDLRLKMCIRITGDHFRTIHHELGHNIYQRAYNKQPLLYQNSANDGFHEAVGDTIALSVTPEYLKQIGLLENVPDASGDIGLLLEKALEKVAFLPFGAMIDQWRWQVFSGQIKPADYNKAWWGLINKYQGVNAPLARTENEFDPGAKYHVPANVPYTRYFLAAIYQFQFHRALCKTAGYTGPLHRCSIYNNKAAGQQLAKMLEMGQSHPWPEAMKEVTGSPEADGTAMLEYFAPLMKWLEEQNKGKKIGWEGPTTAQGK